MSLSADLATLATDGFTLDGSQDIWRLKRNAVDMGPCKNGDLSYSAATAQSATISAAAVAVVVAILADEAARVQLTNVLTTIGAPGSYRPASPTF